jgi:hypothetical protein
MIASTPRSGNTWLRHMVADACGLVEIAAHTPQQVCWEGLPERVILQLHWLPDDALLARLRDKAFRVVVLARHPLDVLVSITHFAAREPQTANWLAGFGGDEAAVLGHAPASAEVLAYACSERFGALTSVSAAWWLRRDALRVRYEDLVAAPGNVLRRLLRDLGVVADVDAAVARNSFGSLRRTSSNEHFWQGSPGLWRRLIPAPSAHAICAVRRDTLAALGYICDADPTLDVASALANWRAIA